MTTIFRNTITRSCVVSLLMAGSLSLLSGQPASALVVQVQGTHYDLEIFNGSYYDQPDYFKSTINGGRMPWWGNSSLASDFAFALADGLSPAPLPQNGPLFSTSYNGTDVGASLYDLSTLGITDVINDNVSFSAASPQSYVVLSAPVPAPLPVLGATTALSFARRLRRRQRMHLGAQPKTSTW